jgi:hypothetical protein
MRGHTANPGGNRCRPKRRRKDQRSQSECSAAATAVGGTGRGDRLGPTTPGPGVSKIWEYIRSHNLQNPENRREIVADDQLRRVFGKDKVTMFEINKCLAAHLT